MALVEQKFVAGQVVYAKIKGYPPWPAIVTHMPTEKKARVQYFNSGQWNEISIAKLTPFHAGRHIENQYLNRNAGFTKAYQEMLLMLKVLQEKAEKKCEKTARIVLHQLTPADIKKIKSDLKAKASKKEKKSLRSGRLY